MKIIFMGTPHFAAPTLSALLGSKHEILAVYTMPPKPAGRGQQEMKTPIHKLAKDNGIKVLTPKNFKNPEDVEHFKNLDADIAVVAAYGVIVPQSILDGTKHGCINVHPSKLPRWRGAAPIQHTILSGDKDTSICIMQMDKGMDTGDIIMQKHMDVPADMTASDLHDITSKIGAEMVIKTLEAFESDSVVRTKQSEEGVTHARKIERSDERIVWNEDAYMVNARIRTFSPRPGAYFTYNGQNIKVIQAEVDLGFKQNSKPGTVLDDDLAIACKTGVIRPTLLQREGKKMMYRDAFLRGFGIPKGTDLEV
jgi:methionyl-tRNA formyltransferase